jgi:hypothetical protein
MGGWRQLTNVGNDRPAKAPHIGSGSRRVPGLQNKNGVVAFRVSFTLQERFLNGG